MLVRGRRSITPHTPQLGHQPWCSSLPSSRWRSQPSSPRWHLWWSYQYVANTTGTRGWSCFWYPYRMTGQAWTAAIQEWRGWVGSGSRWRTCRKWWVTQWCSSHKTRRTGLFCLHGGTGFVSGSEEIPAARLKFPRGEQNRVWADRETTTQSQISLMIVKTVCCWGSMTELGRNLSPTALCRNDRFVYWDERGREGRSDFCGGTVGTEGELLR